MTDIEKQNGETTMKVLIKNVGEELMRAVQTMLNHGVTPESLVKRFPGQVPDDAKGLFLLCLQYMREYRPLKELPRPLMANLPGVRGQHN